MYDDDILDLDDHYVYVVMPNSIVITKEVYKKYGIRSDATTIHIDGGMLDIDVDTTLSLDRWHDIISLHRFVPLLILFGKHNVSFLMRFHIGTMHTSAVFCGDYINTESLTGIVKWIIDLYLSGFSTMTYIKRNMSAIIKEKHKKLADIKIICTKK
jgi:hypothetical protein